MRLHSALFVTVLVPSLAMAQPTQEGSPAAVPRKDPSGVSGVSPFWEFLVQGDAAAMARDFDAAVRLYGEAIASSPKNPLGHYRLGQLHVLRGALDQAETAYTTGLQAADPRTDADGSIRAKLLFCIADLHERRKATDEAIAAWEAYEAHGKAHPKAKFHAASAADRKERNTARKKALVDSAEVKRRIETSTKPARR